MTTIPARLTDMLLPPPALSPAITDPYERPASDLVRPAAEVQGVPLATMLGVPFDVSIMGRRGAKSGPEAVRWGLNAALLYDPNLGVDLADAPKVADFGDIDVFHTSVDATWERVSEVTEQIVKLGHPFLAIGGDHGLTFPLIRGFSRAVQGRVGVISVDGHLDFRISHHGEKSSGVPFRYMLDELGEHVTGERFAEFGIGGWLNTARYHRDLLDRGVRVVTQREICERDYASLVNEVVEHVARDADALYLTFDIDGIDGAIAGATNVPAVHGLSAWQALELVWLFAQHPKARGMDIMEVSPAWERSTLTERIAASLALNFFAGRFVARGRGTT